MKRFAIVAAAAAFALVGAAGTASADNRHDHHHGGLIGDVTVIAPVDVEVEDNLLNVLGIVDMAAAGNETD